MPYLSSKIKLPRHLDRRIKLSESDRADILLRYKNGEAIREIARAYENVCSRRLIQFVLFPERDQKLKKVVKKEKRWLKYYNRENNTLAERNTRRYKQELYIKKII